MRWGKHPFDGRGAHSSRPSLCRRHARAGKQPPPPLRLRARLVRPERPPQTPSTREPLIVPPTDATPASRPRPSGKTCEEVVQSTVAGTLNYVYLGSSSQEDPRRNQGGTAHSTPMMYPDAQTITSTIPAALDRPTMFELPHKSGSNIVRSDHRETADRHRTRKMPPDASRRQQVQRASQHLTRHATPRSAKPRGLIRASRAGW